jgi:hypothetical protein
VQFGLVRNGFGEAVDTIVFQVTGQNRNIANNIAGFPEDGSIPEEDMSGFLEDGDNMINTSFFV